MATRAPSPRRMPRCRTAAGGTAARSGRPRSRRRRARRPGRRRRPSARRRRRTPRQVDGADEVGGDGPETRRRRSSLALDDEREVVAGDGGLGERALEPDGAAHGHEDRGAGPAGEGELGRGVEHQLVRPLASVGVAGRRASPSAGGRSRPAPTHPVPDAVLDRADAEVQRLAGGDLEGADAGGRDGLALGRAGSARQRSVRRPPGSRRARRRSCTGCRRRERVLVEVGRAEPDVAGDGDPAGVRGDPAADHVLQRRELRAAWRSKSCDRLDAAHVDVGAVVRRARAVPSLLLVNRTPAAGRRGVEPAPGRR